MHKYLLERCDDESTMDNSLELYKYLSAGPNYKTLLITFWNVTLLFI